MNNNEINKNNSEPGENPYASKWSFEDIVGHPDNKSAIGIDTQRGILADTLNKFREERIASGLETRVMDEVSSDDMFGAISLRLRRIKNPDGSISALIGFNVRNTRRAVDDNGVTKDVIRNREVPVAMSNTGDPGTFKSIKGGRFNEEDAALVDSQIHRLADMRDDGVLPNLGHDYSKIFDPSTALAMRRTPDHRDSEPS